MNSKPGENGLNWVTMILRIIGDQGHDETNNDQRGKSTLLEACK